MSRLRSTSLTRGITTLTGCIKSTSSTLTLSSDRSPDSTTRWLMERICWMARIMFSMIRRYALRAIRQKYPAVLRRIVYYAPNLKRTFTFLTNNFTAKGIALLYKQRWQVELFFRWIKQHLRVLSFWGTTENAVRIQIYVAVIAYCLVAIVEHDCQLNRTTFNVLRVVSRVLTDKTPIRDLFKGSQRLEDVCEEARQLEFVFTY